MDGSPVRVLHFADTETAYDDPERIGRLAAGIRERRTDRTLVVGAGDNGALGVLAILGDGNREALPFLESVGMDADAVGNHDIDDGPADAAAFAEESPGRTLCANADFDAPGSALLDAGGRRVGLVGVAHPETPQICPHADSLDFRDPVPAVKRETESLRAAGADFVVVLSHCGALDEDIALETDADAVLGGHDHSRRAERLAGTLAVRTRGVGTEFAEVVLGEGRPRAAHVETERFEPAADVAARYRERRAELGADEVVARVEEPVERSRETRLRRESRIGNFAADAYREAVDGTVGLVPGGTIRTGPDLAGDVTVADIVGVVPFEGNVCALRLSGAELRATLEAAGNPHPGERGWVQFHVAGLRARWDERDSLTEARVNGERLRPERTYRVATSPYLCDIDAFPALNPSNVVGEGPPQYEAVLAHARADGLAVACEGRIGKEGWEEGARV